MARQRKIRKKTTDTGAVVALILCGMIIFVSGISSYFSIKNENKKIEGVVALEEVCQKKQARFDEKTNNLLRISRMVGWRIEAPWRGGGGWTNEQELKSFLNDWTEKLKQKYQINKYQLWGENGEIGERGKEQKQEMTICSLVSELEQLAGSNREKAGELISQRNDIWQRETDIVGTIDKKTGDFPKEGRFFKMEELKNEKIEELRSDCNKIEKRTNDVIEQGERGIESLETHIKRLVTEIDKTKKRHSKTISDLENKIAEYEDRLEKLEKRLELAKEGIEIDAKVIVADPPNGYAYIDIGRIHAVFKGLEFNVFSIEKGGVTRNKGRIKIIKIFKDNSQAAIIPGTMVPDDPIAAGDFVNSKVYNRKKAKIFAFAGRFVGKYTNEELKKKIEEFGGEVMGEITSNITYVVVGGDYEKDENYKKAVHLGALVIREKELYDLIGVGWKE